MEPFRGQVGHPDGLTLDACWRQNSTIVGTCETHGDRPLESDREKHRAVWTRRLPLLFYEGRLICGVCRQPFAALRVQSRGNFHMEGDVLARWNR